MLAPLPWSYEAAIIIIHMSEVRELRHGEVKQLAQGDTLVGGQPRTQSCMMRLSNLHFSHIYQFPNMVSGSRRIRDSVAYFLVACLSDYLPCWITNARRAGAMPYLLTTIPMLSSKHMHIVGIQRTLINACINR